MLVQSRRLKSIRTPKRVGNSFGKEKLQPVLTFTNCFYTPHLYPHPHSPSRYLTPYISKNKQEAREKRGGGGERGWESVKLNSFPPSLKRSHGGHDSTLPSGSLKLLISFSNSNDFFPLFSLPSLLRSSVSPSLVLAMWKLWLKIEVTHSSDMSLFGTSPEPKFVLFLKPCSLNLFDTGEL